jgi:hypothetical protein
MAADSAKSSVGINGNSTTTHTNIGHPPYPIHNTRIVNFINLMMTVFWDVVSCSLAEIGRQWKKWRKTLVFFWENFFFHNGIRFALNTNSGMYCTTRLQWVVHIIKSLKWRCTTLQQRPVHVCYMKTAQLLQLLHIRLWNRSSAIDRIQ